MACTTEARAWAAAVLADAAAAADELKAAAAAAAAVRAHSSTMAHIDKVCSSPPDMSSSQEMLGKGQRGGWAAAERPEQKRSGDMEFDAV